MTAHAEGFAFDGAHVLRLGRYGIPPSCFAVFGINYAEGDLHVELPRLLEHARDIKHREGQIPFPELVCCSLCRGKTRRNNGNRPGNPDRLHKSPTEQRGCLRPCGRGTDEHDIS